LGCLRTELRAAGAGFSGQCSLAPCVAGGCRSELRSALVAKRGADHYGVTPHEFEPTA
jgi:hypothetical protein